MRQDIRLVFLDHHLQLCILLLQSRHFLFQLLDLSPVLVQCSLLPSDCILKIFEFFLVLLLVLLVESPLLFLQLFLLVLIWVNPRT